MISVGFRLDAATPAEAAAVIERIREAGIAIVPHHTHRPKRRDEGVFWDGHIVIDAPATPVHAEATRTSTALERRPSTEPTRRPRQPRND